MNELLEKASDFDNAKTLPESTVIHGTLKSKNDINYYTFTPTKTGSGNVMLACPEDSNYTVSLCSEDGRVYQYMTAKDLGVGVKYIVNFSAGTTYYLKVAVRSDRELSTGKYAFYISPIQESSHTWYTQKNNCTNDGYILWLGDKLDNLYFDFNMEKPFFINGSQNDFMSSGCAITSIAMVLCNMNCVPKVPLHDFRTGFYGYSYVDPFIVAMANIGTHDEPVWNGSRYVYSTELNPIYIYDPSNIAKYFGTTAIIDETVKSIEGLEKITSRYYGGVVVHYKNSADEHWVVMKHADNEDGFIVFDAGTNNPEKGCGVLYSNNNIKTKYHFSENDIVKVIAFEKN